MYLVSFIPVCVLKCICDRVFVAVASRLPTVAIGFLDYVWVSLRLGECESYKLIYLIILWVSLTISIRLLHMFVVALWLWESSHDNSILYLNGDTAIAPIHPIIVSDPRAAH